MPSRRGAKQDRPASKGEDTTSSAKHVNELVSFLEFVEQHAVGTPITAKVASYSSHGAYADFGAVQVYIPLRLMADPAPSSARKVVTVGDELEVVVAAFSPERRSIDVALPAMAHRIELPGSTGDEKEQADEAQADEADAATDPKPGKRPASRRRGKKAAAAAVTAETTEQSEPASDPGADAGADAEPAPAKKKAAAKKAPAKKKAAAKKAPAKKKAAAKKAPAKKKAAAKKAPAKKKAAAKKAPAKKKAAAKKAPAKKKAAARKAPAKQKAAAS